VPSNFWDAIPKDWQDLFDKKEIDQMEISVEEDFQPSLDNVFRAFRLPIKRIKIVIVGQDPYPNPAYAMGLAFSVPASEEILPPSLKNIFKELDSDLGKTRINGDLSDWSEQGVLLLNRTLTIAKNGINSHRNLGWQSITERIIKELGAAGKIGILWGEDAKRLEPYFMKDRVITSVHPSPLSAYRGFFGSKPFSKTNAMLIAQGLSIIDW
jgi:uracil-DNA glycosylase